MALWKIVTLNKYQNHRSRIIYLPNGKPFSHGGGLGKFVSVSRFKYTYEHPYLSPSLYTSRDNETYIIPSYQKVIEGTTLNDISWVKPKPKNVKPPKDVFQFESKSDPGHFYKVTVTGEKVDCTCSGKWRVKDRQKGCTHMQQVRKQLKLK